MKLSSKQITISIICALSTWAQAADAPAAAAGGSFKVINSIKTGDASQIFGLLTDTSNRRLYVAKLGGVEVMDLDTGATVGTVAISGAISAVALALDLQRGYATNATTHQVITFDLKSLRVLNTKPSGGSEPTSLEFETKNKRVFVSHRKGGVLGVFDGQTGNPLSSLSLGGALRGVATDTRGGVFIADEERNGLHYVDAKELKAKGLISTWPASAPTSITVDDKERRLYVATASGRMVVVDPDIGQMVGYVPIGKGAGGVAAQFLPNRFVRLFVPTADGQLTVVANAKLTATVESSTNPAGMASTAVAVDNKTGRAFVASASDILVLGK